MCVKSWGRNSYARALVEVLDHVVVAISYPNGSGHSLERIDIEYEWKPPRCALCKIFDHNDAACPKNVKQPSVKSKVDEEGFEEVPKCKGKGKVPTHEKVIDGVRFAKPKVTINYRWQSVSKTKVGSDCTSSSKVKGTNADSSGPNKVGVNGASSSKANDQIDSSLDNQVNSEVNATKTFINDNLNYVSTKNSFSALTDDASLSESGFENKLSQEDKGVHQLDSDSEVDEVLEFGKPSNATGNIKEASTSSVDVPHV